MAKINTRTLIKNLVIAILIILTIAFVRNFWDEIKDVRIVSWKYLLPVILLQFLMTLSNGMMSNVIWIAQKLRLKVNEWYGLTIISSFINFVVPMRGGLVTLAGYLKSRHNFSYSSFLSSVSASYIIIFWVNSLGALVGLGWIWKTTEFISIPLTLFFAGMFFGFSFIMIFSPKIKEVQNPWFNRFIVVINDWHTLSKNYILQLKIALLATVNLLLGAVTIFFQFRVLGFEIGLFESLILSVIGGFSLLLSVTPGNLGVREALSALTAIALGVPAWQSVLVGALDRITNFLLVSLIAPYFLWSLSLFSKLKKNDDPVSSAQEAI